MTPVVRLHHRLDGPGDAPVVVLLHAIGTSMAMWAPQVPLLSQRHRVLAIDLRGHGDSPAPAGPYAMADLARDVAELLDSLGIEQVSLCGLSLGGMVALTFAADSPQRVRRVVAACVVARPAVPAAWLDRSRIVLDQGTAAIEGLVVERWGYASRAPEIARSVLDMLAATSPVGYAGCCAAIASMDLRPRLPLVAAPTLLLVGDADPSAPPEAAAEIAALMPDARVQVIEGAAHLANVEAAAATTSAILEHLGR